MNLHQIKYAVESGEKVYWNSVNYKVLKDSQWYIKHSGGHVIGLTHKDGETLNGNEKDFFIWYDRETVTDKLVTDDINAIVRMAEFADYSYLNDILRGNGFTPYDALGISELNTEWQERFLND